MLKKQKHRIGIISVQHNIVSTFSSLELLWVGSSFPFVVSNRGSTPYSYSHEERGKYEIGFILGWFLWFLDCKILFNISRCDFGWIGLVWLLSCEAYAVDSTFCLCFELTLVGVLESCASRTSVCEGCAIKKNMFDKLWAPWEFL